MNAVGTYCKYGGKEYSKIWLTVVADAKQADRIGSIQYERVRAELQNMIAEELSQRAVLCMEMSGR